MKTYILHRIAAGIPVIWGVSTLVFLMVHLVPGDPIELMFGGFAITQADIDRARAQLGLDRPLIEQYGKFWANLAAGDLGVSIRLGRPVTELIMQRLPNTILLASVTTFVAIVIGFIGGAVAAVNHRRWLDTAAMFVSVFGLSIPGFWLGLMFILIFSVRLGWLPPSGSGGIEYLILPVLTLSLPSAAIIARLTRSGLLEVLGADFITTARAKGLSARALLLKHAFPNALLPVVTIVGLQFGALLAGAFIIETVFAWPGVGRLAVQGLGGRDYPVVQGVVLVTALIVIFVNLTTDILYAVIDPRVRF